MTSKDGKIDPLQSVIFFSVLAVLIIFLLKCFGKKIRNWAFAQFWKRTMIEYHSTLKELKRSHFSQMCTNGSASTESNRVKKQKGFKILEIGAASGANFEFFPPETHLTVVEPNVFFEPMFNERKQEFPNIKTDRFVVATAENMQEIEDNSIDIVVSTLVLCSVTDVEKTLKEIHRVLTPGGQYFYWEHVHDRVGTWLHSIQAILSPIWCYVFDNCHLNRNIDHTVQSLNRFTKVDQKRFYIPLQKGVWKIVKAHVMGVATK